MNVQYNTSTYVQLKNAAAWSRLIRTPLILLLGCR